MIVYLEKEAAMQDDVRWIDVHAHLNYLEDTPAEVLKRANEEGVDHVITIGTCKKDHEIVLKLVDECGPNVYGTLGVHPHEAAEYNLSLIHI